MSTLEHRTRNKGPNTLRIVFSTHWTLNNRLLLLTKMLNKIIQLSIWCRPLGALKALPVQHVQNKAHELPLKPGCLAMSPACLRYFIHPGIQAKGQEIWHYLCLSSLASTSCLVWWIPPLTHTHIPSPLCLHPSHAGQTTTSSARGRSSLWPGFYPSPSNPFFIYSQKQPFFSFCFLSFFLIFQKYFTFSLFKKFFHCGKIHITILTIFKCKYIYIVYNI